MKSIGIVITWCLYFLVLLVVMNLHTTQAYITNSCIHYLPKSIRIINPYIPPLYPAQYIHCAGFQWLKTISISAFILLIPAVIATYLFIGKRIKIKLEIV